MNAAAAGEITAALVVIGDEILSGRTKDSNINDIALHCTAIGVRLREVRVVADRQEAIVAAVNALRAAYDYVFTTGGIGPTHDDITADAIAAAFGVAIDHDPRAVAMLRERFAEAELTPARLRMARVPDGAELIANAVSKAPGFMLGNVIVMAGVPAIMRAMLDAVTPRLRTGARLLAVSITVHEREGTFAPVLGAVQAAHPGVAMGSYPFQRGAAYGAVVVLRATDEAAIVRAADSLLAALAEAGIGAVRG